MLQFANKCYYSTVNCFSMENHTSVCIFFFYGHTFIKLEVTRGAKSYNKCRPDYSHCGLSIGVASGKGERRTGDKIWSHKGRLLYYVDWNHSNHIRTPLIKPPH
eukprot:GHVR01031893.1.p1 GENE.GHVR01031893.1~~GHVR01031893.1.p1  ORF type:complete len:104 (-),score=4.72 GHVR01031893.1:214-525(-)